MSCPSPNEGKDASVKPSEKGSFYTTEAQCVSGDVEAKDCVVALKENCTRVTGPPELVPSKGPSGPCCYRQ